MDSQNLIGRNEKSNTRGHRFKVREAKFKEDLLDKFTVVGERLEHTAEGGG